MMTPDQIIDHTARTESGGRYDAINEDDPKGSGSLSFGLIQYSQKFGTLYELLDRMRKADSSKFKALTWGALTDLALGGITQFKAADLRPYEAKFKALGQYPGFQQVQRDLAREGYLEPSWKLAQQFELKSERAAAMCFDVSVQHGIDGLRKMLKKVDAVPLADGELAALDLLADLADTHEYDKERRHKILRDPALSDAAWGMESERHERPLLKRGAKGSAVIELQRLLNRARGIAEDGEFGAKTALRLEDFILEHDLNRDGHGMHAIETTPEVWAALAKAAEGKP